MNDEPLTPEVTKAIDGYLALLSKLDIPSPIQFAIQSIKEQYEATGRIAPTQIALLQRCFLRAREGRYEVDWLPIGYLDAAIAHELDGTPCQMLNAADVEEAIRWLAFDGDPPKEIVAWHSQIQEQLLLTGSLSLDQLAELKRRYLAWTGCAIPMRWPRLGGARQ